MADERDSSCHNNCVNDPNFAIICSFFGRFSSACGISHPTFTELQEMIESCQEVPPELVDLHVKLLRKIRRSVATEKWERALIKFCHSYYCSEEGWELERGGYKKCKVPVRLKILKTLLDAQFDLNTKFKTDVNKLTAEELRLNPLGRDKVGQSYWCQFDPASNVRVYKEDQDEETWKLVAKDREGLVDLITQLSSGEELLGLELINEDSNSQEVEKPITDTGQVQMSTSEENTADNVSSIDNNTESNSKKEEQDNSDNHRNGGLCIDDKNKLNVDTTENQSQQTEQSLSEKESSDLSKEEVLYSDTVITKYINGSNVTLNTDSECLQHNDDKNILISTNLTQTKLVGDSPLEKCDSSNKNEKDQSKTISRDVENMLVCEVSETERINVTEEIKQRSLIKSSSLAISKGRICKPLMGSKLDQIFSHKLEPKSIVSKNSDSVAITKLSSHIAEEQEIGYEINQLKKIEEVDHTSTIKNNDSPLNENNKRINEKSEESNGNPHKKQLLKKELDDEVGEEIEEPVMFIKGEGSGQDCDTGNPGREKEEGAGTTNKLNNVTSSTNIVNNLDEQHQMNSNCNSSNFENSNDNKRSSKDINNCLIENKDSLFCGSDKTNDIDKINEIVCKNSEALNGSSELKNMKMDSSNCKSEFEHNKNLHSDKHETSIEEQLSFLTGESLSPRQHCNDSSSKSDEENDRNSKNNRSEKGSLKNILEFTNSSDDSEAIPSKEKTAKVEKDKADLFDCLNTNSAQSSDIVNTLTGKINNLTENEHNTNVKIDSEELSGFNSKLTTEIYNNSETASISKKNSVENGSSTLTVNLHCVKESNNHELIDKNEKYSIKKGICKTDTRGSKSKRNIEKAPETEEDKIVLKDCTIDNSNKSDNEPVLSISGEEINPNDFTSNKAITQKCSLNKTSDHIQQIKENPMCGKPDEVEEENDGEKSDTKTVKSENETEDLNNDSETLKCDENIKSFSKKASVKKSPKPRKKLFTPKSRRRAAKFPINSLKKNSNSENILENKEIVQSKKKGKKGDVTEKVIEEKELSSITLNQETDKSAKGNRKRRSSRRNTATEKDSEEDAEICKKEDEKEVDEEDEVGGKRRKLKGKRAPNKSLRKTVENKRKSNSSSEEEEHSKDDEGKESKKSPPSHKQKHSKGKRGEKKIITCGEKPKKEDNETSNQTEECVQTNKKSKTPKSQGRNSRAFLGIDLNIDISESCRSVRQSSRLAQIKIKEQADPKILDESHQKVDKSTKKSTKKKNENDEKQKGTPKKQKRNKTKSSEEEIQEEEVEKKKRRRKKKKNPVRAFNERDPWKSSSGSSSEAEEEEEEYHFDDIGDEEEDLPLTIKSDHEFSPESDLEGDEEMKPIRHARTAQKDPTTEERDTDDFACEKCSKKDHPEWILLCDTCDKGWHASCLRPSLMLVPEGDWHCPPCQHAMLVKKLQETLKIFERDSKRRENEELRKKRLAYVGISLDNVLPSNVSGQQTQKENVSASETSESSASGTESESEESDEPVYQLRQRRQGTNTYRFSEFDELINSAIQDEVEVKNAVFGTVPVTVTHIPSKTEEEISSSQSKDEEKKEDNGSEENKQVISPEVKEEKITDKPITKSKDKSGDDDSSEEDEDNEEDDEEEEFPHVVPKRINTLPRPGRKKHRRLNCLDDPSDDDDGSDEDFKGSSSEEEEDDEEGEDSDESNTGRRRSKRGHLGPVRRSSRTRRSRFDKEFINDDSEESDAPKRKKTRKLWTDSDSESDDSTWGRRKKKRNQGSSGRRKFKKNKKFTIEDELSETETSKIPKKKRQRKIKYGGLDDLAVEDLPSRRTRGKKINYQEVIGSDSEEEILKQKNLRKAIIDDEDEFVANNEEKEDSESASDEDGEDEENSSDDADRSKEDKVEDKREVTLEKQKKDAPKSKVSLLSKPSTEEKSGPMKKVKSLTAMIAPPPERLISEDEQYKAIVSKVSTVSHSESDSKFPKPVTYNEHSNSSTESKDFTEYPHNLAPIKIHNMPLDSKIIKRSPPIKIRSGVPVNAIGRRSPLGSPTNDVAFFPTKLMNPEPDNSLPKKSPIQTQPQKNLGMIQASAQQFVTTRKSIDPIIKSEKLTNEDVDTLEEEDYMDDIEEEEDDEEDDSEDDILEEGEIPKKVARRMARMEEKMLRQQEEKNQTKTIKSVQSASPLSPGAAQLPTTSASEQKPTQPLLRVVSPLKLMANPPGALQSSFIHSGMPARMPMSSPSGMSMPIRPPQPTGMMAGMSMDDGSPKRRGRGRGKKQLGQEKQNQEMMSGGSVIRGMLQQPQSYPQTHYTQQYPPHPRIPFNPQRMSRPPFHPGHHPLDPSPSGGGTINIKQEPSSNPVHIPNKPPPTSAPPYHPTAPPPHRFDSGHQRQPNYPSQPPKPQYNSYPNPSGPNANYHYGNYPPPSVTQREEPHGFPVQQTFNEQFAEQPPAAPTSKTLTEEDSGEFGGLVSYFSSQREEELDT